MQDLLSQAQASSRDSLLSIPNPSKTSTAKKTHRGKNKQLGLGRAAAFSFGSSRVRKPCFPGIPGARRHHGTVRYHGTVNGTTSPASNGQQYQSCMDLFVAWLGPRKNILRHVDGKRPQFTNLKITSGRPRPMKLSSASFQHHLSCIFPCLPPVSSASPLSPIQGGFTCGVVQPWSHRAFPRRTGIARLQLIPLRRGQPSRLIDLRRAHGPTTARRLVCVSPHDILVDFDHEPPVKFHFFGP